MELIGILIITFATLLYDEVIIINKWNLNLYVRKDIIRRGEDEVSKKVIMNILMLEKMIKL